MEQKGAGFAFAYRESAAVDAPMTADHCTMDKASSWHRI